MRILILMLACSSAFSVNVGQRIRVSPPLSLSNGLITLPLVEEIDGFMKGDSPADYTFPLVAKATYARQVDKISIKCGSGSVTAALQINGSAITSCTALSVTTSFNNATCNTGASNNLAVGGRLALVLSSNSACQDLEFTVQTTRD